MTSRIGKSFVQLLTRSAVLMALGLAGEGGDDGCACTGVVEERRGGNGGGIPCDEGCPLLKKDADPLDEAGRLDLDAVDEGGAAAVPCWLEASLSGSGTGVDGSDGLHRLWELFPLPCPVSHVLLSDVVDGCGGLLMKDARNRTVR